MNKLLAKFKALGDRNRLKIIWALMHHEQLCACQITELLNVTGATVSRHLALLSSAELISSRKEGRWIYFYINRNQKSVETVLVIIDSECGNSEEMQDCLNQLATITSHQPEDICRKQRGEKCCPEK